MRQKAYLIVILRTHLEIRLGLLFSFSYF